LPRSKKPAPQIPGGGDVPLPGKSKEEEEEEEEEGL